MALKLMYITNHPEIAVIAENAGVDRVFVDMEYIGKSQRQRGMDTVQSHHTVEDVKKIREVLHTAQLIVRVNPIHDAAGNECSSEEEINAVIEAGADFVMLPYFQTTEEVEKCVGIVKGRAKVFPLLESKAAVAEIDEILKISGIDEIHVGLNDLSLDLKKKFMFELLADGTVEKLCQKFREKGIPYGFGGIGRLGKGELPAEHVIKEHYRLGSTCAILSRSFCNADQITDLHEVKEIFEKGVKEIRTLEAECADHRRYFTDNEEMVREKVEAIVERR
ncbi:MAG: aldolase [Lachnospiraceae bacterium]|nr:aldolase [Lachnospiraceae bacterium]